MEAGRPCNSELWFWMPQRLSHCISSEAEASNLALFSPARLTMPPLNARSLATLALLLCATTLAGAAHGERQQPKQAGVLAAAGAPAAAGAGGPVLQRQLLDDGAHLGGVRSVRTPPGQLSTQLSWVAADGYTHRSKDPDAAPQRSPPLRPYAPVPLSRTCR